MAQARNNVAIQSPQAPQAAVDDDCTWISLWTAQNAGTFLQRMTISSNPSPLVLGARFTAAINAIVISQPAGANETEAMAMRAAAGRVAGGVWIQFHTGDPGTAGTANLIPIGRAQITQAQFTVT